MPLEISDSLAGIGGNGSLSGTGSVGSRLLKSGFSANALRTNATLRKEEWIHYDTAVVEVARQRLVGVADLMSRGMTYNLRNAMGKTRIEWETISDMDPADISMSGISQSQNDRVVYELQGLPVPIIHKDFNINLRALEASRTTGESLDTTQVRYATRKVSETIESMLFKGATVLGTNNTIFGYKTAPNRNTGALTASWMTATGEQIVGDTLKMLEALVSDNMYGPYMIYVSAGVFTQLGEDYKANSDKTVLQRIKEIPGIIDIRPSKDVANNEVLLVQMTSDVVDMINGMSPTLVEWDSHAGFVMNFKVLAIMLPRIRNDQLLQCGIAHYSA